MYIVIDLETENIKSCNRVANPLDSRNYPIAASIKAKGYDQQTVYGEMAVKDKLKRVLRWATKISQQEATVLVGHNLTFDLLYIWEYPELAEYLDAGGGIADTQVAHYMITGQSHIMPKLRDIAVDYYGCQERPKHIDGYFAQGYLMSQIPAEEVKTDVEADVADTEAIFKKQMKLLVKYKLLELYKLRMDGLLATIDMEYNGVYVDQDRAKRVRDRYSEYVDTLHNKVDIIARQLGYDGPDVELSKQEDISRVLHGGPYKVKACELDVDDNGNYKRRKNGRIIGRQQEIEQRCSGVGIVPMQDAESAKAGIYKTNDTILKTILSYKPSEPIQQIINYVLEYRKYSKLVNTYLNPMSDELIQSDGCIHGQYNHTVTATGRLSSKNPNLQNMPKERAVKSLFRSRYNNGKIIELDYSGIEVVAAAIVTQDDKLKELINSGIDMHRYFWSKLTHKNQEDVTKEERQKAKNANFGVLYKEGPRKLSDQAGISIDDAKHYIKTFYHTFRGIQKFHGRQQELAEQRSKPLPNHQRTPKGHRKHRAHIQSITGRIYSYDTQDAPEWLINQEDKLTSHSPNKLANYELQGLAGDLTVIAAGLIWRQLKGRSDVKMVNTVHDSIILDSQSDVCYDVAKLAKDTMESVPNEMSERFGFSLGCQATAEVELGDNWADVEEITDDELTQVLTTREKSDTI
jgi:DNA polymerase I-like protein with 3'-5' exonuclease and polymerase domains